MNEQNLIVVLDGHALNPGDLSWAALEDLGPCEIHARTQPAEIVSRARNAAILLTNKTPISAGTLEQLPGLRYIGVLATGYNVIDASAARLRGIPVTNIPVYGTASVAQHVFSLLLEITGNAGYHARTVREGWWSDSVDWCYWEGQLVELANLSLGIVGAGRIGSAVGKIGEAFGMNVRYVTSRDTRDHLKSVLGSSDVISLHCPLTDATKNLIDAETLSWMKPTAILINTSRGALIDEAALAVALNTGGIAAAGLDVLGSEPPLPSNPLLTARNCLVTPHLAWATLAARLRLMQTAVGNVRAFLQGRPENVVN